MYRTKYKLLPLNTSLRTSIGREWSFYRDNMTSISIIYRILRYPINPNRGVPEACVCLKRPSDRRGIFKGCFERFAGRPLFFCTSTYIGSRINSNWSIANIQTTKDSLVVAIRDALHVRLRFRLLRIENSACGNDCMIFLRGHVFSPGNFTIKMKKVLVVSCVCVRSIFEYRGHVINSIRFKVQSRPREIHPWHAQLYAIRRNPWKKTTAPKSVPSRGDRYYISSHTKAVGRRGA